MAGCKQKVAGSEFTTCNLLPRLNQEKTYILAFGFCERLSDACDALSVHTKIAVTKPGRSPHVDKAGLFVKIELVIINKAKGERLCFDVDVIRPFCGERYLRHRDQNFH